MDTLRVTTFGRPAEHDAAVKNGLYVDENLQVEMLGTRSSKEQIRELLDDVWQVAHTNADNAFWWNDANDADLLIVLAVLSPPNQNLVVRPEIMGYEDLRGKVIAVDASESGYATPLRVLLREAGLVEEGRDFQFVEVGSTKERLIAMAEGRAVGGMVGVDGERPYDDNGLHVIDTINRLYKDYAGATIVRRRWAEENGDLLVRYLRAHLRGQSAVDAERGQATPSGFSWGGLREMLEMRSGLGMLRGPVDPTLHATDRYYKLAVGA
ncbi:MAG: ABC-type nitrate/sulfonate/bicarbonate transport system periplasmic component-like protein [Chloroflexi bacterium]|nr:ABC-type nitrate/sulfonate/bicarbonate transport system periplasmic component-like protein [Chloroflexota bacterium]